MTRDPSSFSDETLSAYVEGALPQDEAEAIEARAKHDAGLAEQIETLRRILAEPFSLEPIAPPPALVDWVRGKAADLATEQAPAAGYDDLLGDALELEQVPVPAHLTDWVRQTVAQHTRREDEVPVGEHESPAPVLAFPLLGTPLRAAAALLAAVALGLLLGRGTAAPPSSDSSATADLERAGQLEGQLEASATDLAQARRDGSDAHGEAREAVAARQEVELALRAQSRELTASREAARELEARLAQAQVPASDPRLAELERALASARAEATQAGQEREALRAERASLRVELETALAHAGEPDRPTPTESLFAARQLERWDDAQGWRPLGEGQPIEPGTVIRGGDLRATVLIGDRTQRLGRGLYLARADGLVPLPHGNGAGEPHTPAGPSGVGRGSNAGRVMATASPFGSLFR